MVSHSYLSRRNFLKQSIGTATIGGGLVLCPWTTAGAATAKTTPAASPLGIADDLANPSEVHSVDGRLRTRLFMSIADVLLPSGPAKLRIFNESLPAPTLRLKAGDTLEIAFENRMPENPDTTAMVLNVPNRFNTTNVHYHGFHVSPRGNSDNVYLQIEPGHHFNYVVRIPEDHPAGNYWYHPHRHGSVSAQVASGAAGMAIIGGALDTVPEVAAAVERVMVLQAPIPGVDGVLATEDPIWPPLNGERNFLINGAYRPRIYMREGEVQHWRVLHAGDAQFLPLTAEGLELYEIGRDGNPLPRAEIVDTVDLAPGNRVNLLVKATKPGTYQLLRPAFNQGKQPLDEIMLADIVVIPANDSRVAAGKPFGRDIPAGDLPKNRILTDIADSEITMQRKFVLGMSEVKGFFKDTEFTINSQPFDPRRDDVTAKLGAVEEWTLVNTTPYPHPLHIHVNPFQLMDSNGVPDPRKPWLDTVAVPASGTVRFRTRFTDFAGRYVMHCHILPHEDTGMMINVNIEA
ncbi:multicopper oxidase domain-containing protein [Agrobacterium sp. a22-2]|uniref:multicopper oxidase family protein n=1 Tax=Agrobacterium sp. a22-2 TaxID=2283840 RepID=UPI001AEE18F4